MGEEREKPGYGAEKKARSIKKELHSTPQEAHIINIDEWIIKEDELLEESDVYKIPERVRLPLITVRCYGHEIKSLIDTGASISVISSKWVIKFEEEYEILKLPTSLTKVKGIVPNKALNCKFQVQIEFEVNGLEVIHIFLVLSRIKFSMILGMDFLRKFKGVIDTGRNLLMLKLKGLSRTMDLDDNQTGNLSEMGVFYVSPDDRMTREEELNLIFRRKAEESMLTEDDQKDLIKLLHRYERVFNSKPGKIRDYQYKFSVTDWSPYNVKPYPVPIRYRPRVQHILDEMMDEGIISMQPTPFLNPLVIVPKNDGTIRICLDARRLNVRLVPENDRVPNLKEILRRFAGMRYFTVVDLTASYHHIELEERSRLLTGFLVNQRTYVFNRLPFGLKNSGAALIRALDNKLTPEVKERTVRYVDDILIATATLPEHFEMVNKVLENLECENFKVNIQKSKFCNSEILFVGHVINQEGIRPNPLKIAAIENFPTPQRIKQVRQFLGICNFFSDHCPDFTNVVAPLQSLLRKNNRWKWTEEHDKSFSQAKQMLKNAITLSYPDWEIPFIIQTDASAIGIGGMLYQEEEKSQKSLRYISFASRRLRAHEMLYNTTELEMLSIVYCLEIWRKVVYGFRIILRTDHKILTFMLTTTMASTRVQRWCLFVQQFNLEIQYCKGKDNIIPDALSRNPTHDSPRINYLEVTPTDHQLLQRLKDLPVTQLQEEFTRKMIAYLIGTLDRDDPMYRQIARASGKYHCINGVLYKYIDEEHTKLRVVLTRGFHNKMIDHVHRITGHSGIDKVCAVLKETFVWPKMRSMVRQRVITCDLCQRAKWHSYMLKHEFRPIIPEGPTDLYAMDLYGPLPKTKYGNRYIVVTIDVFSKYVTLFPIQRTNARSIIRRLNRNIIPEMGKPKSLLTDHGTQFTGTEFRREMDELQIRHLLTSIRHPEANPSERIMKELAKYCRIFCSNEHWRWIDVLPDIMDCINNTKHESTQEVPLIVHFNRKPVRPWHGIVDVPPDPIVSPNVMLAKVRDQLKHQAERRLRRVKDKRWQRPFRVGDYVLIRRPTVSHPQERQYSKFNLLFVGPYKVITVLRNNSYIVQSLDGQKEMTFNAANLKRYYQLRGG